jgi:hypothetical protein
MAAYAAATVSKAESFFFAVVVKRERILIKTARVMMRT